MVKLVFNPKDTNSVVVGISKTSKKVSKQGNLETFVKKYWKNEWHFNLVVLDKIAAFGGIFKREMRQIASQLRNF